MTTAALERKLQADAPPPDYRKFDLLNSPEFRALVQQKQFYDAQKKSAEDKLKEIGPEIEAMLTASEVDKVTYEDGWQVKIGRGRAADKIVATKLIELGVSVDVLAAATEEGKPYTFAQLVAPKKGKGQD